MSATLRHPDRLRPVRIKRRYTRYAPGSVLIQMGHTKVLCTAMIDPEVPRWLKGKGKGWVTAEYGMLPGSSHERIRRDREKVSGRTMEIQRLIARSLRAVVNLEALGERQILVDCDVLQADGGTRTAAITGAYIALWDAVAFLKKQKLIPAGAKVFTDSVAAVSVGIVKGVPTLDLCYEQDSTAETDMNVVMTGSGKYVEVQGTAEREPFSKKDLDRLLSLAQKGLGHLRQIQKKHLKM